MKDWRERVRPLLSARALETPILNDEMPIFLDELAERLVDMNAPFSWTEEATTNIKLNETAVSHGQQRFDIGYDIVEVVKEYGLLREILDDQAEKAGLIIGGEGGHALNFTFNKAAATAVESFQKAKELEIRNRRREYLSFIMHDLKTPLNAVKVAANVIEQDVEDPKSVVEMVRIIIRGAEQLDAQLQKTITLEKATVEFDQEDLVPRTFELWPVTQAVLQEFRLVAADLRTTVHNLIPANLFVYADALALETILRNLLSNAIKYSPGGKVVLGVTSSRKDAIEIWVRDNGEGISPERQAHLFEKVEPDDTKKGSSGVGLYQVKKLVEAHSGRVTFESTIGDGSTFRVILPLKAEQQN